MSATTGVSFEIEVYLDREREAVEAALRAIAARLERAGPPTVAGPARYALEAGGKRLRPIFCAAAYRAVSGREPPEAVYTLACALELVHTYSLVHDDLPCMDDDDLRRGRPTTHRVYGVRPAVVAGAALIPAACETAERAGVALGLTPGARMRIVRELAGAAGMAGMVGGQLLDLGAEGRRVGLDELERIHRAKTGALLAVSLRIGAIAAGGGPDTLAALDAYGRAVGLAFQIADDVLDVTGSFEALGKTAGRDEALGKSTFPALLGLEEARRRARLEADHATESLRGAGLATTELVTLARYTVERGR